MKIFVAFAFICCCNRIAAQQKFINEIISHHSCQQSVYTPTTIITEQNISIGCAFGKSSLFFPANMISLDTMQVTAIDLVFTDYPSTDSLITLNSTRLQNLLNKYPSLEKDQSIEWKLVRQTGGMLKDAASILFHGFVIYYRPAQNKTSIQHDLIKLKESLTPETTGRTKKDGFAAGDTTDLRKKYEIEEYSTILKMPTPEALRFLGLDEKEKTTYKAYDSLFVFVRPSTDSSDKIILKPPVDSTVLKVFDRMPWKNMLVVADVTASMYPYTGQLLYWVKLHEDERRIKTFSFFNDGDQQEDEVKVIGNTGGIYTSNSSVFEVIEQLVYKTMSNGNGGNVPENNIEALIKSVASCPHCNDIILIADNASAVSDMVLLKQLNTPVHIIVCGVRDAVNTDYLTIAKHTGGSVHIADEDVQLSNTKEGERIMIHGRSYKISNGKFVMDK
jgi:hypothetical protein